MPIYSVIVGNVGTVYTGDNLRQARARYREECASSATYAGRSGGEPVTLTCEGEPMSEYAPMARLPPVGGLSALVRAIKRAGIDADYRASDDPEDNTPGVSLTVGWEPSGAWSYQTGDNGYTGGAYGYPHWAVVSVYRRSSSVEIARDIRAQLLECLY